MTAMTSTEKITDDGRFSFFFDTRHYPHMIYLKMTVRTADSTIAFLLLSLLQSANVLQLQAFSLQRHPSKLSTRISSSASPIDPSGWPDRFPAKQHCSKCGLCETSFVSHVKEACAFIDEGMSRMDAMEEVVHGRRRDVTDMVWSSDNNNNGGESMSSSSRPTGFAEEARFGVLHKPVMLAQGVGIPNAQWTGCVTGIAMSMLESGMVDAVVCIANSDDGKWSSPEPILAKTPQDVLRGRGVKPALAPSLRVLDEIKNDQSIRKLLFCGVGCAVQGEKINDACFLRYRVTKTALEF
jgi:7-hydroxymethyl chlorophyll a reductase